MHGIYFSVNNGKEGFRLPVNPEVVEVTTQSDGQTFNIAKSGNVNIPKDVKLSSYTIESFFPAYDAPYVFKPFKKPSYYVNKFKSWQTKKLPIRYMYVDGSFVINELVTIEEFKYSEKFGSADVDFSLSLMKYVPFGPKKMKIKKPLSSLQKHKPKKLLISKKVPMRQNKKEVLSVYILKKGECLWTVAQNYYGNGFRYKEIQKLNGIKESDLRKLPVGLKLKLPPK